MKCFCRTGYSRTSNRRSKVYIDVGNKDFIGFSPIRVLNGNILHGFENISPQFLDVAIELVNEGRVNPGIQFDNEIGKVEVPRVAFGTIFIQETFLAYVWGIIYSMTTLYHEVIHKMSFNDSTKGFKKKTNQYVARNACKLWEYSISLIEQYSVWPHDLPNPEFYRKKDRKLVEATNGLYIEAVKFILAHEFSHILFNHNRENVLQEEIDADNHALELLFQQNNNIQAHYTKRFGILIGMCSLVFFTDKLSQREYPDTNKRIHQIIDKFKLENNDGMWGIATLAYKLWDTNFTKNLVWKQGLNTPMDLYNDILHQIEALNNIEAV